MTKPMKKLFSLLIFLLPAFATAATPLQSDPGAGHVKFLAVGKPSALKIHGTSSGGPSAQLQTEGADLKGSITFAMEKLDTGIGLRTQHMKEKYLQVKEYPEAKLTLLSAPIDSDFAKTLSNQGEKPFRGKLLLHGKEKDVAGTYTAKQGVVVAKFPITLSDFAVDVPKYLGITVADTVEVEVGLTLRRN